jgi:hypothetical protein
VMIDDGVADLVRHRLIGQLAQPFHRVLHRHPVIRDVAQEPEQMLPIHGLGM